MHSPAQHAAICYDNTWIHVTTEDLNIGTRTFINQHDIQNVIQIGTEVRFHHFNYHNFFMFPNTEMWPNSEIVQYSYHLSVITIANYVPHAIESWLFQERGYSSSQIMNVCVFLLCLCWSTKVRALFEAGWQPLQLPYFLSKQSE